jgi:peptidoglycan/xylan/chitin deacetylase (PgdA/CDA1 family)
MRFRIIAIATAISFSVGGVTGGVMASLAPFGPIHVVTGAVVLLVIEALLLTGVFERRAPFFGSVFWRGPVNLRAICLTFDDGPNEPHTSQVLDVLEQFDVKATFFLIGKNVETFPDVVSRMSAGGHDIGNHGYDHSVLPLKSPAYIRDQIEKTNEVIERVSGRRPSLFRASHGWRNPWVNRVALAAGCLPVAWTLGVWDTDRPGAEVIRERTLEHLENGCIVLLHDGRGMEHGTDASQLIEALPHIIRGARERGYRFITLSEMIRESRRS